MVGQLVWQTCIHGLLVERGKVVVMATHALHFAAKRGVDTVLLLGAATSGGDSGGGGTAAAALHARPHVRRGSVQAVSTVVAAGNLAAVADTAAGSRFLATAGLHAGVGGAGGGGVGGFAAEAKTTHAGEAGAEVAGRVDGGSTPAAPVAALAPRDGAGGGAGSEDDEGYAVGGVHMRVVWDYIRSFGSPLLLVWLLSLYLAAQAATVLNSWWMAVWTSNAGAGTSDTAHYVAVYAYLNGAQAAIALVRMITLTAGALRASTVLHNAALRAVLAAPARFFSTNPAGRILNRFLSDVSTVDDTVRVSISSLAQLVFQLIATAVVMGITTPVALAVVAAMSVVYWWLARQYRISARDLRRMQSVAKSPVISHFAEAVRGVGVLRAFGPAAATAFVRRHVRLSRAWARAWIGYWSANEFISTWLEGIGSVVIAATCMLAVWGFRRGQLDAAHVGFLITALLQVPSILMWLVRYLSQVETDAVSLERLTEYRDLVPEAVAHVAAAPPQVPDDLSATPGIAMTPDKGLADAPCGVLVQDVWLRYGEDLPWVLKGLSLRIPRGAKVALVGRTGSGKSSIVSALMQLYPVQRGTLRVGSLDLGRMRPDLGRLMCAALLQDGTLFTGSVRENLVGPAPCRAVGVGVAVGGSASTLLRPSQRRLLARMEAAQGAPVTDEAVWAALDAAGGLSHRIRALPNGLDAPVAEYGGNFSVGERALLCLARLLLRLQSPPPPSAWGAGEGRGEHLVIADEPTASVDAVADAVVHDALLSLPNTLVCVCHRLHHVPRFDLVAVVHAGVCVEVGPPAALLRQPGSAFAALVSASASARADDSGSGDGTRRRG